MRRNPIRIVNFKPLEQCDRFRNTTLLCRGYRLLQLSFQLATQVRLAQRDLSGVHVAQLDQMVNRFTIVTLGEGPLHGTIASVEWYGAALSITVALDASPGEPVLVTTQRGHARMPEKGTRVSLRFEADDVVLVRS